MKILSKILVDSYYELGSESQIPLMMEWDAEGVTSIGVSKSNGHLMISKNPVVIRSAVFPIQNANEDLFSRICASLEEWVPSISIEDTVDYLSRHNITPRWIIGSFYKNSSFEKLFSEDVGVLHHKNLEDSFLIVPGSVDLGFFTVFSKKGSDKAYATYTIRNPLTQICLVKWKTS